MGEWEQKLFDKIKNQEKLDYDDLQVMEGCLRMHSWWDELLETGMGGVPNSVKLEYADKYIPQ